VEVRGGGLTGLGYSYTSYGSAYVTKELLADIVIGRDAFGVEECWWSMLHAVRLLMDTDLTVEGWVPAVAVWRDRLDSSESSMTSRRFAGAWLLVGGGLALTG